MIMTDAEIRRSYREAKYPEHQLQILAELNLTTVEKICDIVEADLPTGFSPYQPRKNKAYRPVTEEEKAEIIRRWADGDKVAKIAVSLGRPTHDISNFIAKHRAIFPKRTSPRHRITAEERAEILRRLDNRESIKDIALAMGCTAGPIYRIIKERITTNEKQNPKIV